MEIIDCRSVKVDYNTPVEPYYSIEDPNMYHHPVASADEFGLIEISGTIEKAWVNIYYLRLLLGGVGPTVPNFEFDMRLQASSDPDSPILYLYNCRFKKGSISIPANGWLEESYDFIAFSAGTNTIPPLPTYSVVIDSRCEWEPWHDHEGEITISPPLETYVPLPQTLTKAAGDYTITYIETDSNIFNHWESTGSVVLDDPSLISTVAHISGTCTITAVFHHSGC
jgi:hypothetical protein